jgi:hypothetical protein
MQQLTVYVPESHLNSLKEALFAQGAGQIGHYSHCCWQTLGQGQFKPLAGSQPHTGKVLELCTVQEYKLEMVVADGKISDVITALKQHHPYETPAYHLTTVTTC